MGDVSLSISIKLIKTIYTELPLFQYSICVFSKAQYAKCENKEICLHAERQASRLCVHVFYF